MTHILGLRFRENGQIYYFDAASFEVRPGQHVLVKTDQGLAMASVASVLEQLPAGQEQEELKPIVRIAAPEDMDVYRENRELARDAIRHCRRCINERNLDMKLVDVEILQDRSKMVFYFTAPGRIDFRELVKDLVKAYRTRIELRQIGVRHETQMLGAIGNCGQMCCCARFIRKFQPVTIKMAKEQNLFLNPAKISGMCGRLLCCLAYEQGTYEEFQRRCPKIGKKYQTEQGPMKVLRSNIFRECISVYTEAGEERELTLEEWNTIAGDTWVPYVAPQQPPGGRPAPQANERPQQGRPPQGRPQQPRPPRPQEARSQDARAQEAGQPGSAPQRPGEQPSGQPEPRPAPTEGESRAAEHAAPSTDGDDGEIVALGLPSEALPAEGAPAKAKRKRKRKPKNKRPEGGQAPTPESGD
ncbi:MAG: regulatory iron-sulfur-containing complex subunit RicT [Acidobacteriota bacterium]